MTTPNVGAPEWSPSQATPWLTENEAKRIWDAFGLRTLIEDRDLTAPPVTCDDGACYLVDSPATDDWLGQEGKMAIAVGENAANGWLFVTIAREGAKSYVRDEAIYIEYIGGQWTASASALPIDIVAPADGDVLIYEASSGRFYNRQPPAPRAAPLYVTETNATAYAPVAGDADGLKRMTAGSAITVTIPANTFAIGTKLSWIQKGAGQITVQGDTGVTVLVNSLFNPVSAGQHALITAIQDEGNVWTLSGTLDLV